MNITFRNILAFSIILIIILVTGCKKATEPENNAPVISAVTVTPGSVATNANATVTVTATDADSDALTYAYAPNGGAISGMGAAVIWTAPGTAGAYSIAVTVTDGQGGEATGSGNLTVTAPAVVTQVIGTAHFLAGVSGDLNNSKVSLYTSWDNWWANSPIKFGAVSGSGANVSFTLSGVNPGNYYLDIWKDVDNDGFWSTDDFVGWYGSGGLSAPALTEFQITEGQTVNLDILMYVWP